LNVHALFFVMRVTTLPVTRDGVLVGLVTRKDVRKCLGLDQDE